MWGRLKDVLIAVAGQRVQVERRRMSGLGEEALASKGAAQEVLGVA